MDQPFFVVDAFTQEPFRGNPAAVVPLSGWPSDSWLQNVAMEMNHAETAFFAPEGDGFRLRWFTPTVEVELCGHATLATAKVLFQTGKLMSGAAVHFQTRSGLLAVRANGDDFAMDFPLEPAKEASIPDGLLEGLGLHPVFVGKNRMDYLVQLENENAVRALKPVLTQLEKIPCRGIIVTAAGNPGSYDCVSRFFAPNAGVNEDPVTGSAHCCLADFWSRKLNKHLLTGYQASSRGGEVGMEIVGNRVILKGKAVLVAKGQLMTRPL